MSSTATHKVGVIVGSQRSARAGRQITEFVVEAIKNVDPAVSVSIIDLRDWNLPLYDEPQLPTLITSAAQYAHAHTRKWSAEVASRDAFVFVTPQYNWGYPAGLKNAIDHLFNEWTGKPGLVVSYGGRGGGKAAAQLKEVLRGVRIRPVERTVGLAFPSREFLLRATAGEDLDLGSDEIKAHWSKESEELVKAFEELIALLEHE